MEKAPGMHGQIVTFTCQSGESAHEGDPEKIRMKFFRDKFSLRNHAVKHFTHDFEKKHWARLVRYKKSYFEKSIGMLLTLDCQAIYASQKKSNCCVSCPHFSRCTPHVQFLEDTFSEALFEAIKKGLSIPRNVGFSYVKENKDQQDFWLMCDEMILVKMEYRNDHYVIRTSFVPQAEINITQKERILNVTKSIKNKTHNSNIAWCTSDTWNPSVDVNSGRMRRSPQERYKKKRWR